MIGRIATGSLEMAIKALNVARLDHIKAERALSRAVARVALAESRVLESMNQVQAMHGVVSYGPVTQRNGSRLTDAEWADLTESERADV